MGGFADTLRSLARAQAELVSTWVDVAVAWQDSVSRNFAWEIINPLESRLFDIQAALQDVADAVDEFHAAVD